MSELFDTARSSIAYHIGNIFKEKELVKETSVEIFDRSNKASRPPQYYNLDVIISVRYRIKSQHKDKQNSNRSRREENHKYIGNAWGRFLQYRSWEVI